jgi:hypothetical protein
MGAEYILRWGGDGERYTVLTELGLGEKLFGAPFVIERNPPVWRRALDLIKARLGW